MKKFELTTETNVFFGRTLYRIRALRAFGDVDKGELGGFVEKEANLSHEGNAWVSDNAQVSGNARVFDNARVYGNARVSGNAWVYGNARVFDNARVYGNARVSGNAWVFGNAEIKQSSHYLVIGPIGSRDEFTTFFRSKTLEIMVYCGCFFGTIKEFEKAVNKTHGDNAHGKAYRLAIALAVERIEVEE